MATNNFEELKEQAIKYWRSGFDEVYIVNQFAEKGVDNNTIDRVIYDVKKVKKAEMRGSGVKLFIYGLSFIIVGLGLTWWSTNWDFEYIFILWGLPVFGVMTAIKGLGRILGL